MRWSSGMSLVAALVAGYTALVGPAFAGQHRMSDPTGDVAVHGQDAPTLHEGDISSLRIVHGEKRVRLVTTLRALPIPAYFDLNAPRVTPSRGFHIFWSEDGVGQTAKPLVSRSNGKGLRCPDSLARVAWKRSKVTLIVPTSCLREPRWVRAGMSVTSLYGDFGDTVDYAGTHRVPPGRGPLSPRVREG